MKTRYGKVLIALILGVALGGGWIARAHSRQEASFDIPQNMKPYYLIFLMQSDKSVDGLSKDEHDALMQKHLAYLRAQVEAGKYLLVGPVMDNGKLKGMAVAQVATADEALKIEQADPMAQGGWVKVEVHPVILADLSNIKMEYPAKR